MGKQPFWQKKYKGKRPPTERELKEWLDAAERRAGPTSRTEIIAYIAAKNPHRWWRIQYDYRWLQKQMKRLGLNPEDAKELL